MKVVEQGLEVVLSGEACVEQEAFDEGPFTETSIVEHLQLVGDDEVGWRYLRLVVRYSNDTNCYPTVERQEYE